jgi:hypothetical protein
MLVVVPAVSSGLARHPDRGGRFTLTAQHSCVPGQMNARQPIDRRAPSPSPWTEARVWTGPEPLLEPLSILFHGVSCVSSWYLANAAETHETVHRASGMRYPDGGLTELHRRAFPRRLRTHSRLRSRPRSAAQSAQWRWIGEVRTTTRWHRSHSRSGTFSHSRDRPGCGNRDLRCRGPTGIQYTAGSGPISGPYGQPLLPASGGLAA